MVFLYWWTFVLMGIFSIGAGVQMMKNDSKGPALPRVIVFLSCLPALFFMLMLGIATGRF